MPDASPPSTPPPPLPWNVRLLGAISLLNDIASEMLAPLLPAFLIGVLGGSKSMLGMIDGVSESVASLLKLWSGGWSDRAGARKGFISFGYGVAVLARPLMALAGAPWHVFALRAIDRAGKGIRTSPRDALIAESTPQQQHGRAFGFHRAMDHLGAAIGPLVAFGFLWLFPDRLRWLFALSLLPGIPILILVWLGLKEPPDRRQGEVSAGQVATSWSLNIFPGSFRRYLLALLIFTLGNSSDSFLLVRAEQLGVGLRWLPILWFVFHVAKSLGNLVCGGWTDRFGPRPLIWAGWLIYAGVYLGFGLATAAWHAWALFLVYAAFYALTEPAEKALVARIVGSEHKGLAFGWFNFTIGLAILPASLAFGWLYDTYGPLIAFGTGAGLAIVAGLLLLSVSNPASEPSRLTVRRLG